jgi:pSer/pThr/pTyr-binding forkhead associated (FHA) protein
VLYAFLGVTFYVLWQELRLQAAAEPSPALVPAVLHQPEADGDTRFRLQPVTTIGRADDNTLILEDPYASAHHALILWREGRWWIEDLDSHNGTLVNDERITDTTHLTPGDAILVGETVLRFERA